MTRIPPAQQAPGRPVKDRLEPVVRLLSWIPSIIIMALILSLILYIAAPLKPSSGDIFDLIAGRLRRLAIMVYESFFPSQLNAFNIACLILLLIFLACILPPLWVGYGAAAAYVAGIFLYFMAAAMIGLLSGILGIEQVMRRGAVELILPIPSYGLGIGDFFLAGFLFLLSFSGRLVGLIWRWASAQAPAIIALIAVVNAIAFASMWLDKRQSRIQGAYRLPERALIKYSALGGGPGIIAAALIFRHKTGHTGLLASICLATAAGLFMLIGGLAT
jgi:uncharacterized membrane protein YsdA (DUF1294 family)